MVQDAMGLCEIECGCGKRKTPRIRAKNSSGFPHSLPSQGQVALGNVYASRISSMSGKLQQVTARAAANLEHLLSRMGAKLRRLIQPGIDSVPLLFAEV